MHYLNHFPRVSLSHSPTPLEKLPRLSDYLNVNIWVKRDDCTGLAGGGNKTRKLEFLMADAIRKGADTVITVGGLQSNHARQTAAAAAKLGLACELVLEDVAGVPRQDYYRNGNLLLDQLCGAKIHRLETHQSSELVVAQVMSDIEAQGKKPYLIPLGGSNALGSLGYVACAAEIVSQSHALHLSFDQIVVASGSAGTQAGVLAGLIALQQDIPVLGMCVSRSGVAQQTLVEDLLKQTLTLMEIDDTQVAGKVKANGDYYGEGYGISTDEMTRAVQLVATLEGLLLDPVYTGKAMAGLIDLCQQGFFTPEQNILFIHTGGSQGLFAYSDVF
ncbi:D-cysteine desulfhydrase [uncultured Paraglaciecola sp.]|uniref:D-cysteine desulfhydrase n=1 Tax=uncultured Paraglaciecola sp. TaxID=1765024 RepID=UPI0030DA5A50|tara:strand:+ start:39575 stop:40567 length:993 start_codon:yes stop_codon:yes gene_type:complete